MVCLASSWSCWDNTACLFAHVKMLRYNAVSAPYLCLVHSVNTKPSGHFLRIIGPISPKTNNGRDEDRA